VIKAKHILNTIFIAFLIGGVNDLGAQSFYQNKPKMGKMGPAAPRTSTAISAGFGANYYVGDLTDNSFAGGSNTSLNFTLGLQQRLNDRLHLRAELMWYEIQGDDALSASEPKIERNLSFRAQNIEFSFVGIYHFLNSSVGNNGRSNVVPYVFFGAAVTTNDPKAELNGQWYLLRPLQTEGVDYGNYIFAIPFGGGIRFKLSEAFDLGIEGGYRFTFTDYLDDVSTVYAPLTDQLAIALADRSPELGLAPRAIGSQRGDPSNNDGYFILNLKLQYYLPGNLLEGGIGGKRGKKSNIVCPIF
jgi:hypothetical protein